MKIHPKLGTNVATCCHGVSMVAVRDFYLVTLNGVTRSNCVHPVTNWVVQKPHIVGLLEPLFSTHGELHAVVNGWPLHPAHDNAKDLVEQLFSLPVKALEAEVMV